MDQKHFYPDWPKNIFYPDWTKIVFYPDWTKIKFAHFWTFLMSSLFGLKKIWTRFGLFLFGFFWPNTTVGPPWVYFDLPNLDLVCFGPTCTRNLNFKTGERLILVQAWAKTKLGHQLLDQKVQIKLGPNRSRSTYSPRQFWAMPGKIFFGPTIVQKFSNQKSPTFLRPNLVQIFLVQIWSKFFLGQIWSKFFLGQIWSKFFLGQIWSKFC